MIVAPVAQGAPPVAPMASSSTVYMYATSGDVKAYNSIGGSYAATVKKGRAVKMTHTVKDGWRKTSAGNWIKNTGLAQTGSSGTWGTCGKVTLGGATFASGKIGATMGHVVSVNGTGGSYAKVTLWTRKNGEKCAFGATRSQTGRVGRNGIVADAKRKQDTLTTPAGTYFHHPGILRRIHPEEEGRQLASRRRQRLLGPRPEVEVLQHLSIGHERIPHQRGGAPRRVSNAVPLRAGDQLQHRKGP